MTFLYSTGIQLYYLLVWTASVFNKKARCWIKGRKQVFQKMESEIFDNQNIIWIHAASLGEFEQGRPIIEKIKENYPSYKILLTFYSPSGYEIRKNYEKADFIYYLPLDTRRNARKFVSLIKPRMVFFIKYEFWYHFLSELKENSIPVYLVSAIFRKKQAFFKPGRKWYRKLLRFFTHFFVQNQESKELLHSIGYENVTVSGDTRFDRVSGIVNTAHDIPLVDKFCTGSTIIAGSTWQKDEELLAAFINKREKPGVKMIIAPHEIHKSHIEQIYGRVKKPCIKFSEATEQNVAQFDVLIIDNIGMLSSLYRYGCIAYIGGGFGKGIHNILEPATFGLPVVFGPAHEKFREALMLKEKGAAFPVSSFKELNNIFDKLLGDEIFLQEKALVAKKFVSENTGATEKILSFCKLL